MLFIHHCYLKCRFIICSLVAIAISLIDGVIVMLTLGIIFAVLSFCLATPSTDVGVRIVNGTTVDISEYPYQVAILYQSSPICGGVLISAKHVLTALHCWVLDTNQNISEYSVRAGSNYWDKGGQEIYAESVVYDVPPGQGYLDYDIAIITLKFPVNVSNAIPIVMDEADAVHDDGEVATLSGWGLTQLALDDDDDDPYILRAVNVTVIFCGDTGVLRNFICFAQNGTGPCYGDSGGPAVINKKLVGLTSTGGGGACGSSMARAYYTRISTFREWIQEITGV
ncbi:trypsin-3-like [Cylas formicarius]|uniref:trypsin-3-like n=1 Tax=Cylas formicarius TaxID=197179 RepID=UPI0029588644|nr:trypsin-3-like [Cylas formicarius]